MCTRLKSPPLNGRDSYLRDGVKYNCPTRVSPKDDRLFQNLGYTIQVRRNTLAADSSRARTLHRIAMSLVAFICRLTNVSIERRQGEARKTTKKETKRDTREYEESEESSLAHVNQFARLRRWFEGGSGPLHPLEASLSRDRHGRLSESFISFFTFSLIYSFQLLYVLYFFISSLSILSVCVKVCFY